MACSQPEIETALWFASEIDLANARVRLGERIGGAIPDVLSDGAISLRGFRHPVLVLKQAAALSALAGTDARYDTGTITVGEEAPALKERAISREWRDAAGSDGLSQEHGKELPSRLLGAANGARAERDASEWDGQRAAGQAGQGWALRAQPAAGRAVASQRPRNIRAPSDVMGNDLSLNATVPGLILTGPNAGFRSPARRHRPVVVPVPLAFYCSQEPR